MEYLSDQDRFARTFHKTVSLFGILISINQKRCFSGINSGSTVCSSEENTQSLFNIIKNYKITKCVLASRIMFYASLTSLCTVCYQNRFLNLQCNITQATSSFYASATYMYSKEHRWSLTKQNLTRKTLETHTIATNTCTV